METVTERRAIAFDGARRIAEGPLGDVVLKVKQVIDRGPRAPVLIFDAATSERIDVDVRGSDTEVLRRLARPQPRSPGRPRLGVIAREVTLLPRHWEWLNDQPGGASVTLRKLVDQARHASVESDRVRKAREATYRFIMAMAGDRPQFEEACRALFAGDVERFIERMAKWPSDIRAHAEALIRGDGTGA